MSREGPAGPRMPRWVPVAVVLLAPIIGVLLLRAPLFNNVPYRDPWFYPGYGWSLAHHVEIFGWFYYAVRFPAVLLTGWSADILGPVAGYIVLRYLLLVGVGAALFTCVRRFSTPSTACAAVLLLGLNPFFIRLVLWDYTTYVALPAAIAGAALWMAATGRGRGLASSGGAGALFAVMVFANPSFVTLLASIAVVEGIAAVRRGGRGVLELVVRGLAAVAGGIVVYLVGWLAYRAQLGDLSLLDLIRPTLDFVRDGSASAASFERPPSEWLDGEPKIWAPIVLALATLVLLGREILGTDLRARLAQVGIVYIAALWLYRFAGNWAAVETWWAYTTTAFSMAFLAPVLLDAVLRRRAWSPRARLALTATAVGTVAIVDLLIRVGDERSVPIYTTLRESPGVVIAVGVAAMAAAAALRHVRSLRLAVPAVAAVAAASAALALTPALYIGISETGEFVDFAGADMRSYDAAYELNQLLERREQPHQRVLLWSPLTGLAMIGWAQMPHQGGGIMNSDAPAPLTELPDASMTMIRHPNTDALLVMSEDPADLQRARATLAAKEISFAVEEEGAWADGNLHYAVLDLR